jgi:hypothetical protein
LEDFTLKIRKKDVKELYQSIKGKIKSLDFDKIYKGFKPFDFALYTDDFVVLKDQIIKYDNRFIGNTAIMYEGDYLAIWKIESIFVHFNIITSKIVHEMFHAYQYKCEEKRFPNEFFGLGYKYEKYNIATKYDETKFLLQAIEEEDMTSLLKFITLREKRRSEYEFDLLYEEGIETVEGTAKYVELQVLSQLSLNDYQKVYDEIKNNIKNIKNYIPIRWISYDIGCLILMAKDRFNIEFKAEIGTETNNIYNLIFSDYQAIDFYHANTILDLSFLDQYYQSIVDSINKVLISNPKIHQCDQVIGFDPLNSFRIDKYIYYRHFVMIKQQGKDVFIHNESVGEVNELNQVFAVYERVA